MSEMDVDDWWRHTEAVFHEAIDIDEPERTRLLEQRCEGDTAMMAELRSLLRACEEEQKHQSDIRDGSRSVASGPYRIGPYVLDHLLGRGGMGAVYLAHRDDGQFRQQVAIKIIDMPLVTELFRERFRTERQILAGLAHPYIARLLDGGVSEDGELYLAMEYIEGESITRYCEQQGLTIAARLQIFQMVCEAVQYAHQNLIVHRDLKPDNIHVTADGTPRLLDFGTAKILTPAITGADGETTRHGLQTFTPRYASPEQILGQPIGTASDIYSLGVLLFLLLTGEMPYELKEFSTAEMVEVVCEQPPLRPTATGQRFGKLDSDLDAIVLKALRKEPAGRYSTAEQMAADVQAYKEQRPVLARRGSLQYRATKFVRRNRVGLIAAALLFASVLAGMAGIVWQSRVANQQRRRAETRAEDLRQLSNSLLSEIDDAIKDLPGSTPVQHLLVTRVVEHLDRIARESDGSRDMQLDIARGYLQLGNIQGNAYEQNIGDISGALVNERKALAIARALVAANSNDKQARELLGGVLHDMGATDTTPQGSVHAVEEAIDVHKRILTDYGDTETANRALSADYAILADDQADYLKLGRDALQASQTSIRYLKHAIDLAGGDPSKQLPLIRGLQKLSNLEIASDSYASLEALEEAVALWNALPDESKKSASARRAYENLQTNLGVTYTILFERDKAQAALQTAVAMAESNAQQNPKDSRAQYDLYAVYNVFASTYEDDADPRIPVDETLKQESLVTALRYEERGIAILEGLVKSGLTEDYYRMNILDAEMNMARIKAAQHKTAEAIALEAKFIPAMEKMTADKDLVSDTYYDLAQALATASGPLRNTAAAVDYAAKAAEMSHYQDPLVLLRLAEATRANHEPARSRAAAQGALALLAPLKPGQAPTRLTKLVEYMIADERAADSAPR